MSFNYLPDQIESLLWMFNRNHLPLSAEKIATILSHETGETFSWVELVTVLHDALELELIKRYNPNFKTFHGNSIGSDDNFVLSTKGKEYLKNLQFEKEKLDREKEALNVAKKASKKADISNLIAIISFLFTIFIFFSK
ncbi:MAG: hypothetical protein MJH09_10325 [Cetobacterium sp.]|nr:hypothetical protein [Cetobacterium sp.]